MKKECCIKTIEQIENWLKGRTYVKSSKEGTNVSLIKFMPFEWAEFKSELLGELN